MSTIREVGWGGVARFDMHTLFPGPTCTGPLAELSPAMLIWEVVGATALLRERFLFSLLVLAGTAKLPTGGSFVSPRA
jgi:hypothetical protein